MQNLKLWAILSLFLLSVFLPAGIYYHLNQKVTGYEKQRVQLRELSTDEETKLYLYQESLHRGYDLYEFRRFVRIIHCESSFRRDAYNPKSKDWGLWQINQASWDEKAKELGLDYKHNWKDNIDMGFVILKLQGIKAWSWSEKCWK